MDSGGTIFRRGGPAAGEFWDRLLRPRQHRSIANELRDGGWRHRPNQLLRSFRAGDNDGVELRLNRSAAILPFNRRNKLLRHLGGRGFHEHNDYRDDYNDDSDYHHFNHEYH